jgi:hypothetical protein
MSNENLEQRINIKFCAKIGKRASETLALLTVVYGEYTVKKLSVLNGTGGSRKGEKMHRVTQGVSSKKHKGQMQIWTEYELWCTQFGDQVRD